MSTPPLSPSARSPTNTTPSPASRRKPSRTEHSKPNESWFLILVNAFKSNFEQTLTYRESELYAWIMQAYPYYRHDMHTMQTSVKTTLSSYECFRQNGRSTWTFIPRRALVHLESLKSEEGREDSIYSGEDEEDMDYIDDEEIMEHGHDEDSPTLSFEEIQRFKQEHSGARKLKRKASGGHPSRPRARSPLDGLQDECSMSMEAWCNLLVQMFEASPKQKTIREIFAWVHDNYPIYRNAPGDGWQKDLTAALESNPLFKAMGRGRWQMVTQAPQPVIVVNGGTSTASGSGTASNPPVKAEDDATDSPSVTEDEDWKAIGSKRLLNFSFRRYSIATDTVPKGQYKTGSTTTNTGGTSAAVASSSSSTLHASTSGGKLAPLDHPHGTYNTTGRRFSSYHQPTPKNSPPLSATTVGLSAVPDLGFHITGAMTDETDDDEDPARRYMAPLQSAINSAVLALQSQHSQHKPQTSSQEPQSSSSPPPPTSPLASVQEISPQQEQQELKHEESTTEPTAAAADTSTSQAPMDNTTGPEPGITIPSGEDLASDQMDAIQALALLCGGGV
ncbi:hypothetical protein BGX31_006925 [Mortierella sp. GBA43]|nr:hypothetical protein BGX31_006925 [Mortierella sp. GBA43]